MAEFNFDELSVVNTQPKQKVNRPTVGYFNSLKDDGDEAIVRFNYASSKEFNIISVHNVTVNGKYRNVSCLEDNCPFCRDYDNKQKRFFVKLIEYTRDENGNIVAQAKVWNRPFSFAYKLNSFLAEYGDLRNYVFKIKRCGAKGYKQTTYEPIPANPAVYKDELYVKDFSAFDNFDLSHHSYMVKTREEMEAFCETGTFPDTKAPVVEEKSTTTYVKPTPVSAPTYTSYSQKPAYEAQTTNQVETTNTEFVQKPKRTYTF